MSWFNYITENPDKPWNYRELSCNPNITIDIIHSDLSKPWSVRAISCNPNITWEIVQQNPNKPWDYYGLSENPNITWEIVQQNSGKPWCNYHLTWNPNITWDIIREYPCLWNSMLYHNPNIFKQTEINILWDRTYLFHIILYYGLFATVYSVIELRNIIRSFVKWERCSRFMSFINQLWTFIELLNIVILFFQNKKMQPLSYAWLVDQLHNGFIYHYLTHDPDILLKLIKKDLGVTFTQRYMLHNNEVIHKYLTDCSNIMPIIEEINDPLLFASLSCNPNITMAIVNARPNKPWCYHGLSRNPNVTWSVVQDNPDKPWNYQMLSRNKMSKHPHFNCQMSYLLK